MSFAKEMRHPVGNRQPMTGLAESAPGAHRAQLAVLAVAVTAAASVVGWLLVRGDAGAPSFAGVNAPVLVSQTRLEELASSNAEPLYWAGPRNGFSYELTRTADGRTYVRYLPRGVRAGDPRAEFLTVGTYEHPNAFADLKRAGTRPGAVAAKLDHGGVLVFSTGRPRSVYFGYPGQNVQIEVYAPAGSSAALARAAGEITPIG
jgi:hypothetical protein